MTATSIERTAREVSLAEYPLRERVAHAIFMRAHTHKDEQAPSYRTCLDLADAALSVTELRPPAERR